ncbi:RNA helicase [Bacteroides sp. HMSC073E02]|uniref:RNA helicase n=1 Tax=Bacteroides sp. HMSC073E02 TaxID=1739517 RepID=UPI000AE67450|nr:RNA helicase [Bacteroides sp. HMSC073E02]
MNSNYFYSNIVPSSKNKDFLEEVQTIAESIKQQIYVLSSPLVDSKYQYNDDSLMIVLSSKRKIAFVTTRKMNDDFKDLCEDIIEDIGSISDKYGYKEKIGRPRKWRDKLTSSYSVKDIKDVRTWFCEDITINDADDFRTLDLLVSLFIGSINDVKRRNQTIFWTKSNIRFSCLTVSRPVLFMRNWKQKVKELLYKVYPVQEKLNY